MPRIFFEDILFMLKIEKNSLIVNSQKFAFPAVRLSINSQIYTFSGEGKTIGKLAREYTANGVTIQVKVELVHENLLRKYVKIFSEKLLPTPDWVEADHQKVADPALKRLGYKATTLITGRPQAEEAGGSLMPGCGYPLIGKKFYAGIEHPAAFATVEKASANSAEYALTQHPVWSENNSIELAPVVIGWAKDPENALRDYVDSIRLAPRKTPMVSLCSFWSDPYLGNYEYLIAPENYKSFVDAYSRLGLKPTVYTLDAGWQDRQSIFQPKPSFGGQKGLDDLGKHIRKRGSRIGLWLSHNGPMGIAPEYLEKSGFDVGSGESSSYCGTGYGILLNKEYEKIIGDRFVELAKSGALHFKFDWDNDCAVNDKYKEKYPTRDHVREGSIDAIIRIAQRINKVNPDLMMRYGWWPSPWWLKYTHHIFLSDSGDSEYSTLPARTQRDSAATYRDTVYYCNFNRDKSVFPLDAIDNHEFPHALRNPFHEDPGTIANIAMLAVMRGCSYLPLKLQPEALEPWFVEILRNTLDFARSYGKKLYGSRSRMIGGNPNAGEIYGFRYEQSDGSAICMLRNPSTMPQEFGWNTEKRSGVWIYPYFARYTANEKIVFAPHEVKVIVLSKKRLALPYEQPFQITGQSDGSQEFRFPAQLAVNSKVQPMVGEIYRIGSTEVEWKIMKEIEDGLEVIFKLKLPYRMRNTTINAVIAADDPDKVELRARVSRYAADFGSCYEVPITRYSHGVAGHGIRKNPEVEVPETAGLFSLPASEGGEAYYSLFFKGVKSFDQIKLSVSGIYAVSREALKRRWSPKFLEEGCTVPQHPEGFPMAEFIELPDPKDYPPPTV